MEVRREGREESVLEETPLLRDQSGSEKRYSSAEEAFDPALERVPVGVFHLILVCVCGWAIASDSVEIQCISFVTPQLSSNQVPDTVSARERERESVHIMYGKREREFVWCFSRVPMIWI